MIHLGGRGRPAALSVEVAFEMERYHSNWAERSISVPFKKMQCDCSTAFHTAIFYNLPIQEKTPVYRAFLIFIQFFYSS